MKKNVIVTAHDFGLCDSVNNGILYTLNHRNNIITELSLLPNAPGSENGAKMARDVDASVSLNLNLTTFLPLSPKVFSLVTKNGTFKQVDVSKWDFSVIDEFDDNDVTTEIDAQWNWFIEKVGKKPSAILSRKNEIGDPKILKHVVEKAKKEKVPLRTPVWMWQENYGAQSFVTQENVRTTENIFVLPKDWKGRFGYDIEHDLERLIDDINSRSGVTELLVLLGFVDRELFELSTVNWQRGQFISLLDRDYIWNALRENFNFIDFLSL